MWGKSRRIIVKLPKEEYKALTEKCKAFNVDLNDFVLKAINDKEIIVSPKISEFIDELKNIENNLNEFTVLANKGAVCFFNLEKTGKQLNEIWEVLNNLQIKN